MEQRASLPRVTVLSLGGTIASTKTKDALGGVVPQLDATDLTRAVPELNDIAVVDAAAFLQVASGDLQLEDLVRLSVEIGRRLADGSAGVVVTQGTDSIEESAFALDLLVASDKPVVVTGAMRNPTLQGADGPANLLAAVQVAAAPSARGAGCLVVLNDEIHAARFVHKTNTSNPATFRSVGVGPVGWITEGKPHVVLQPRRASASLELDLGELREIPDVYLARMCLGDDGRLLQKATAAGYSGVVVEGFGGGHVPSGIAPLLEEIAARVPVILASRTGSGSVLNETYGFPGSERDLISRGLIPAGFLDGLKARILLSILLAQGYAISDVRDEFRRMSASA